MTRYIPLATFDQRGPAEKLQRRLHLAGLESIITDESERERVWFLSEPRAAVHLEVEETGYLAARDLIKELDISEKLMVDAVRCPDCGSSRIEFPQITRKFAMPVLHALLMKLRLLPRTYFCRDCQCTWPEREPMEPEVDVLGFPRKPRVMRPKRTHRPARRSKDHHPNLASGRPD